MVTAIQAQPGIHQTVQDFLFRGVTAVLVVETEVYLVVLVGVAQQEMQQTHQRQVVEVLGGL